MDPSDLATAAPCSSGSVTMASRLTNSRAAIIAAGIRQSSQRTRSECTSRASAVLLSCDPNWWPQSHASVPAGFVNLHRGHSIEDVVMDDIQTHYKIFKPDIPKFLLAIGAGACSRREERICCDGCVLERAHFKSEAL